MKSYYLKAKKLILENKHLIIPFSIVGVMFLFIVFSLGVPNSEESSGSKGCGGNADVEDVDTGENQETEEESNIDLTESLKFSLSKEETEKMTIVTMNVKTYIPEGLGQFYLLIEAQEGKTKKAIGANVQGEAELPLVFKLDSDKKWTFLAKINGQQRGRKETFNITGDKYYLPLIIETKKNKLFPKFIDESEKSPKDEFNGELCDNRAGITFKISNLFAYPAAGPFMFDLNNTPFKDDKTKGKSNYAYQYLTMEQPRSRVCGDILAFGGNGEGNVSATSEVISDSTGLIERPEDAILKIDDLSIFDNKGKNDFGRLNVINSKESGEIMGEAGDLRTYRGAGGRISIKGDTKLESNYSELRLATCYPSPFGPQSCGQKGQVAGIGTFNIDRRSNQTWLKKLDPDGTGRVEFYVKSMDPIIQACVGTFDVEVEIRPVARKGCYDGSKIDSDGDGLVDLLDQFGESNGAGVYDEAADASAGKPKTSTKASSGDSSGSIDQKDSTMGGSKESTFVTDNGSITLASDGQLIADIGVSGLCTDVVVIEQYIYSACGTYIIKIDMTTGKEVGRLRVNHAGTLAISGDHLFALGAGGLTKIDRRTLKKVGTMAGQFYTSRFKIIDGFAYLTNTKGVLFKIDTGSMKVTGKKRVGFTAYGVEVVDGLAYFTAGQYGLIILDIKSLKQVKILNIGFARDITIVDGFAYVSCDTDGVAKIDIKTLEEVGRADTEGNAMGLFVWGNYAYVADKCKGLRIIYIITMKEVGHLDTPDHALCVTMQDGYIYVAIGRGGLLRIKMTETNADDSTQQNSTDPTPSVDKYTVLLLHMDGDNNGNVFKDSSGRNHSVTPYNVTTFPGSKKFGNASASFGYNMNKGMGSYLQITPSDDFKFGAGDWTIDFWVMVTLPIDLQLQTIFYKDTDYSQYDAEINAELYKGLNISLGGEEYTETGYKPALNKWEHYAFVRHGNMVKLFVDGVEKSSKNVGNILFNDDHIQIGHIDVPLVGFIDEFRISKGIARWTSNFVPGDLVTGVASENLVGHWKLDEGEGATANDSTENANHGSLKGTPSWSDGVLGKALTLDGGDYVDAGSSDILNLTGEISISLWFKTGQSQFGMLVNKYDNGPNLGYLLHIGDFGWSSPSSKITFRVDNGGADAVTTERGFTDNKWHHVVAIHKTDGSMVQIFVDGIEEEVARSGSSIREVGNAGNFPLRIGQYSPERYNFTFRGGIDDVRIYNKSLKLAEIEALFGGGTN